MQQTFSAGGVVLSPRSEVLVVNQNGNSWSLPKGHIDNGETARQAAEREIREEAGVAVEHLKDIGSYQRYRIGLDGQDDQSEMKNIELFAFKTDQHELKPEDPTITDARWVKPDDVAKLLTHPKDKEYFESILPQIKELVA